MPGVSGHLVGTVLLAVLLGPAAAIVTMSAILLDPVPAVPGWRACWPSAATSSIWPWFRRFWAAGCTGCWPAADASRPAPIRRRMGGLRSRRHGRGGTCSPQRPRSGQLLVPFGEVPGRDGRRTPVDRAWPKARSPSQCWRTCGGLPAGGHARALASCTAAGPVMADAPGLAIPAGQGSAGVDLDLAAPAGVVSLFASGTPTAWRQAFDAHRYGQSPSRRAPAPAAAAARFQEKLSPLQDYGPAQGPGASGLADLRLGL